MSRRGVGWSVMGLGLALAGMVGPGVGSAQVSEAGAVEAELFEPMEARPVLGAPPAQNEWTGKAGFFVSADTLVGVGRSRGALARGRLDLGLRIRNRTGHLGVDIKLGMGGGRARRFIGRGNAMEMGFGINVRGYVNPQHPVQFFFAGGFGFGVVSVPDHDAPSTEECPSFAMFYGDLSAGAGLAFTLSRQATLSTTVRAVRRSRLGGDLSFVEATVNPPLAESDQLIGVAATVTLVGYLSAAAAND